MWESLWLKVLKLNYLIKLQCHSPCVCMMYDKIKMSKPNFQIYGVKCTIIAKMKFKMKTTLFQ